MDYDWENLAKKSELKVIILQRLCLKSCHFHLNFIVSGTLYYKINAKIPPVII